MSLYLLMLLTYVYLALIVAVLGRRTRLGFWRSLGLSLVLTPVGAALVLFLGYEARMSRSQRRKAAATQAAAQAAAQAKGADKAARSAAAQAAVASVPTGKAGS